jgi:hypothetical protein
MPYVLNYRENTVVKDENLVESFLGVRKKLGK